MCGSWSRLWTPVGTPGPVCHRCFLTCLCWRDGVRVRVPQGGLCGPQGCIMGNLSLRGHEERGQHISDIEFQWGSSILHHLWPFSISLFIPGVPSGGASGNFYVEWKQNKAAMATLDTIPSAWICPIKPPGIPFLPPAFLLNAEQRRWVHWWFQVAWTPFSSLLPLTLLCSWPSEIV